MTELIILAIIMSIVEAFCIFGSKKLPRTATWCGT